MDYLLNHFKPRLSAPGTNHREDEEQLMMYWVNFLEMMEGNIVLGCNSCYILYCPTHSAAHNGHLKLKNQMGEVEELCIDLKTILIFTTGASYPPPGGFGTQPTIAFQDTSPYPRANTCANTIYLPLIKPLVSSEEFAYSIAWHSGFGRSAFEILNVWLSN